MNIDNDNYRLQPPSLTYPHKNQLKKDELHACEDYYAIAWAEGTLTSQDRSDLQRSSRRQLIEQQAAIYQKLKIKPDSSLRYKAKNRLYRPDKQRLLLKYSLTAASCLLFMALGITLWYRTPSMSGQENQLILLPPIEIETMELPAIPQQTPVASSSAIPTMTSLPSAVPPKRIPVMTKKELPVGQIEATPLDIPRNIQINALSPGDAELILSENAIDWKPSENRFRNLPLFSSVIQTGKIIAERLKTAVTNEDFYPSHLK